MRRKRRPQRVGVACQGLGGGVASRHPHPAAEAVAGVAVQTWATNRELMGIHVNDVDC